MRRPSRPVNQNSRSGCQSIDAALAVLNDVRKSRFFEDGSSRTISRGLTALSQLATSTGDAARCGLSALSRGAGDVVVVIGGNDSNNTRELAATCTRHCPRVHHVQTADGLRAAWFGRDDVVGITAGTSTPDDVIEDVERWLQAFASAGGDRDTCSAHTNSAQQA